MILGYCSHTAHFWSSVKISVLAMSARFHIRAKLNWSAGDACSAMNKKQHKDVSSKYNRALRDVARAEPFLASCIACTTTRITRRSELSRVWLMSTNAICVLTIQLTRALLPFWHARQAFAWKEDSCAHFPYSAEWFQKYLGGWSL